MIAYTMLGTNDLARAATFYDELLGMLGGRRAIEFETAILYAGAEGTPFFCITRPLDGKAATVGNGSMIALAAPDPETVRRLHATALACGGTDEGAPRARSNGPLSYYAAYFRDLDGNKLNFFCPAQDGQVSP
jgi:catechol 2,3-dioxygenase-like lactoylglutathione lyase family enzyme